jgi:hypothetical protein
LVRSLASEAEKHPLAVKYYMASSTRKKKKDHPLLWIVEPLMEEPSYLQRPMFGCLAVYLHSRLSLVLASGEEPWKGHD